jgi:hypothetical protein
MRQLHAEHSQIRHHFECANHCSKPAYGESVAVAVAVDPLRGSAEIQCDQSLKLTQLLDSRIRNQAIL